MIEIKKIYRPLFSKDYSFLLYYGGRSGGKSYGVADSYVHITRGEKRKVLICRETKQSMEKSIVALYRERIEHFGYYDFIVQKEYIKNKITGSEFYFVGLNDSQEGFLQAIKSIPNIDDCIIEEAQSISKRALSVLIPTIKRNAKGSRLVAVWNPQSKQDAIWDLVENPRPRTLIQNVNYYDNTFCPQEAIEEAEHCKVNKPEDYEHIWLGKPKDLIASSVTKYFTNDNIKQLKYLPDADLYLSCDFNTSAPMSWVIAHKDENKVYFIDEIVLENADTREAAEEFIKRYGKHQGIITICGDASGDYLQAGSKKSNYNMLETLLTQAKLKWRKRIRPKNPQIIHRVEAWNNRVLTTFGERCLYISPKCKWLLYNIYNLAWKEGCDGVMNLPTSTQIRNNPELNFLGHIFDAASYLVEIEFPVVKHKMEKIITKQNFIDKSKGWTSLEEI